MINSVIEDFEKLSVQALIVLTETFDCRKAEPIYISALQLIKKHPECRQQFINSMLTFSQTGKGPWELTQFCMRELQWPEIKEKLSKELNANLDPRRASVIYAILDVYEIEWKDSDLYEYYSKK